MGRIAVVAMPDEVRLAEGYRHVIVTGVGSLNVIEALSFLDKDTPIANIGYAGSNSIPKGRRVRIGTVMTYHPNVRFEEPAYALDGDTPCYTSSDFVTHTDITEPCAFDMELAYILAMGFTDVISEKVISDNLNVTECEESVKDGKVVSLSKRVP